MQYISPLRFFEKLDISTDDISDVKKLKKIVNLEFISSETGIIEVDGFDYNKQDLLQLLSDEYFEKKWNFHKMIWDNKDLLDVLEREAVDIKQLRAILVFKDDADFCAFVSTYFAKPFSNITKILLNEQYIRDVYLWLQCRFYIGKEEEEIAYDSLRKHFEEALYIFRNINNANYESKRTEIESWETENWSSVLNSLPDYLYYYRDAIAEGLTHVLVVIQYNEKGLCYSISSWLVKLNIASPVLVDTIKSNHRIFEQNASSNVKTSSKSSRSWGGSWIYFLGVALVKILIGLGTCNNEYKVNKSYSYDPVIAPMSNEINTSNSDSAAKMELRETVYPNMSYNEIANSYYRAYQGQLITNSGKLSQKSFGKLPIYVGLFEAKNTFLSPFRVHNNTGKNLEFIRLSNNTVDGTRFPDKSYIYCDPNENQSVDFLLDSVYKDDYLDATRVSFSMNGAQSIAFSVGKKGEVKLVDNTNPFIVNGISDESKKYALTISVTQKNGKYHFDTKGTQVFFLTKK